MRLDQALVTAQLARSRAQAQTLIAAGNVEVAGRPAKKASQRVEDLSTMVVTGGGHYVGRAAHKLLGALHDFPALSIEGRTALDAGASTGGFTQVLLEAGASSVYAVDVGHGQLDRSLAAEPRVHNIEGVNLRQFSLADLGDAAEHDVPDLVVGDLSFISLTLVIPELVRVISARDYVLLVKPQFEVGRGRLNSGGIVTDRTLHVASLRAVLKSAGVAGLSLAGVAPSRLIGANGNQEYIIWLQPGAPANLDASNAAIAAAVNPGSDKP